MTPGAAFEQRLIKACELQGLLVVQHGTKVRYLRGGLTQAVRSDLDFRIASPDGKVVFFDAKTCAGSRLSRSAITPHQHHLIQRYAQFKLVAGVIAELRGADAVVWYSARRLASPARGWGAGDGLVLGRCGWFSVQHLAVLPPG